MEILMLLLAIALLIHAGLPHVMRTPSAAKVQPRRRTRVRIDGRKPVAREGWERFPEAGK